MNQEEFPVYPNIQRIVKIVKFKYNVLEIKLFAVYLYNENDLLIEARQYLIQGDEYKAWNNDDQYIMNLIKKKIQEPWFI